MDSRNPIELLQKGYYATLGVATSVVESIQDQEKRQENIAQLRLDFSQLAEIWADKGKVTETEARKFVDIVLERPDAPSSSPESTSPSSRRRIEDDLISLTETLAAIRQDLEAEESGQR